MLVGDGKPGAWCWGICFWENIGGIWGVSAWTMPLSWPENNAPILDNLYKKCYNKCNDDNKKVICHQNPKFALYGVFPLQGIKSRRTPENAVQTIYIKYGNTKNLKLYAVDGQHKNAYTYIYKKDFLLKIYHVVTIWLQLSGSLDSEKSPCYNGGTVKERIVTSEKVAVCQKLTVRTLKSEQPFLGKDTISGKYAKMAKAGACQKMEAPAVVAEERYPKTGNPILYSKW